jgi:hypothetical protein
MKQKMFLFTQINNLGQSGCLPRKNGPPVLAAICHGALADFWQN